MKVVRKQLKLKKTENKKCRNKNDERYNQIVERFARNALIWISQKSYKRRCLQIFLTLCYVVTNTTQVIALYLTRKDRDKLFKCASVLTFCGMGMLKQISLHYNSGSWQTIIKRIGKLEAKQLDQRNIDNEVEYDSDSDENVFNHIDLYTKRFKSLSSIMLGVYTSTCIIFVLSPFIEYGLLIYNNQICQEYPHILPGWSPLDRISLTGYIITLFCELVAAIYCVQVHICFDIMVVGIIIFVCGQFSFLKYCCETIGGKSKSLYSSEKRDARALHRIRECHYLHKMLLETIYDLNNLVTNILGLYYAVAAMTLCSTAVQINSANLSVTQLISLFQYMLATLIQLFLFCSFGNDLVNESSIGMGEGPYGANYWCLSPKVRRQLLILANSFMKARHLKAGAFFLLDMPSFIQIIRTAYSYYAVIREKTG